MKEGSNKILVYNSFILQAKLVVTLICGLLATRFSLTALGSNDFGLYAVIGGVISFIAIVNTTMLAASNRGIAFAIGKKDNELINRTFNVNFVIHTCIAVLTLIFAIPFGYVYIDHFINYSGNLSDVQWVFNISVIGAVISFVGVPFNGLLLAKERFIVFCSTDIVAQIVKVLVTYWLCSYSGNRLLAYAILMAVTEVFPVFVYYIYCRVRFYEHIRFRFVKQWAHYKEVLSFSLWTGYGALATFAKWQGSALIINMFFDTVMNAALGLANRVNSIVLMFAGTLTKPISPQITKSYAAGDIQRCETLVIYASRLSFSVILLVGIPFMVEGEYILQLWLGEGTLPPYTNLFVQLLIIDALIGSLNAGIPELVFATGKIRDYQLIVNTLFLTSVLAAYFVLKAGAEAYFFQVTLIVFSIVIFFIRQIVLNMVVKINNMKLIKQAYLPCILLSVLCIPVSYIHIGHPIVNIVVAEIIAMALTVVLVMTKKERKSVLQFISSHIK